jgi:hypothetical protein
MAKLKVALYWASSCGGCEIATLAIHEKILKLAEVADIVFWPVGLDFKYADVEKMADKAWMSVFSMELSGMKRTSTWPNSYEPSRR